MQAPTILPSSSLSPQPQQKQHRARSLRTQMMLGLGLVSLLVVAVALSAFWGLVQLRESAHRAVEVEGRISRIASQVAIQALQARRYEKDYFLNLQDPRDQAAYLAQWQRATAGLIDGIEMLEAVASSADDRRQAALWRTAATLYLEGFDEVRKGIQEGRITSPQQANEAFNPYRENVTTLTDLAVQLAEQKEAVSQHTATMMNSESYRVITIVIIATLLSVIAAIGCSLLFPLWVMRPIAALHDAATHLEAGDLSARVGLTRSDELGVLARSFDQMATTIQQQMADLEAQYAAADAARNAAERASMDSAEQLAMIETQRAVIIEMSVPILPLNDQILIMPLIGALDTARISLIGERALAAVEHSRCRYLILDITGVPVVDSQVAQGLVYVVQAVRLLGAEVVLVGIRPEVVQTIVGLGINLGGIVTRSTLRSGVDYSLQR